MRRRTRTAIRNRYFVKVTESANEDERGLLPFELPDVVTAELAVSQAESLAEAMTPEDGHDPLPDWTILRSAMGREPAIRAELEQYSRIVVENYNPTSRAARFVYGSLIEWGLALAAYAAGLLALPDGHDADGTDLRGVVDQQRGLWSVKASASPEIGRDFIIRNFRAKEKPDPETARSLSVTVFISPCLPGLVLVDPARHSHILAALKVGADSVTLPVRAVVEHAESHQEYVIPYDHAANPGGASQDSVSGLDLVRGIVDTVLFPRLRRPFQDAAAAEHADVVTRLRDIQKMVVDGVLTSEQAEAAKNRLLGL